MKVYREETIPETTRQVLDHKTCDLCGKKTTKNLGPNNWDAPDWHFEETDVSMTIKHETGESYPEGIFSETCEIDICPECFQHKLIPWLKAQGVRVDYKDSNR